jgi:class 3 adenylate cyclase/tetratricopeptide (TPR) repeat protein
LFDFARFCQQCGRSVWNPANEHATAGHTAERRQITVLHGRFEGFRTHRTPALHAWDALHLAWSRVIQQYAGFVADNKPNGIRVYFGYPSAQGDDAQRAVAAALEMDAVFQRWLKNTADVGGLPDAATFWAVHTGLMIVGSGQEGAGWSQLAVGDAPSIATSLTAQATQSGILVSETTRQLLHRSPYTWVEQGRVELRGVDDPLRVWRMGERPAPLSQHTASPMVGREPMLALLQAHWQTVQQTPQAPGAMLLIAADAGMGKSLLMSHLVQHVQRQGGTVHTLQCAAYHSASDGFPLQHWLESQVGITPQDSTEARRHKLQQGLPGVDAEDVGWLMQRLGWRVTDDTTLPPLSPGAAKARTDALLAQRLMARPERGPPNLVVIEDVHWADPTTLAFVPFLASHPVWVVMSARLHFAPPADWPLAASQRMALHPLSQGESEQLIAELTQGKRLPASVMSRIWDTTQGHPFYLTEFTKAALNSGYLIPKGDRFELIEALPQRLIPSSLRDPLSARLDRLGPANAIARCAAVLGVCFYRDVLAACLPADAMPVHDGLQVLMAADLVREIRPGSGEFSFCHALLQSVAYDTMLRSEREAIHARVAACLDQQFPDLARSQPALVARHLGASRQAVPAIQRWIQASLHSLERCAYPEAIAATEEGLNLLPSVPPSDAAVLELLLLSLQGPALIATMGFAAPSVGAVYARTEALSQQVGNIADVFPSLWGNWVYHMVSGRLQVSLSYAERMQVMGERLTSVPMLIEAHWTQGNTAYWQGQLPTALACLDKAIDLYRLDVHRDNATQYGQDPGVAASCYRCYTLLALGHPTSAWHALQHARAWAQARQHPSSTSWPMAFEFMYWMMCHEPEPALAASERALVYCHAQNTPFWQASAHVIHGWATACLHDFDAGWQEMQSGMAMYQQTGSRLVQPVWYRLLADVCIQHHHWTPAQEAITQGMQLAQVNEEVLSLINLHTTQAQWACGQGQWDSAWAAFDQAQALAHACQARWPGLRVERLRLQAQQAAGVPVDTTRLTLCMGAITGASDRLEWQLAQRLIPQQNGH